MTALPGNIEELRRNYAFLSKLRLLAQMRQKGRSVYADLDDATFGKFFDKLLHRNNCQMVKEVNGVGLMAPQWSHRSHATKSMGIKAPLWAVIPDNEYRIEMLVHLVAMANSSSLSIDISDFAEMRKGMKAL